MASEIWSKPNWANCEWWVTSLQLTSFEWFLLSVPQICLSSSEEFGLRIATTIQAYIEAGGNLDRVIGLSREASASTTWRSLRGIGDREYEARKHEIIIELNICQLVNYTKSVIQDRLSKTGSGYTKLLGEIGQ